jgi:hypothetical protein
MFELGARWGANLFSAPLLAGVRPGELRGPLSLLNVLSANNEAQLHQLLGDISKQLGLTVQNPASYVGRIPTVKRLAEGAAIGKTKESTAAATDAPRSPDFGQPTPVAPEPRDPYTKDLELCVNQLLDQMTYSGWLLLRHLLMHEPAIDSQPFIEGISIGTQNEQMATAVKAGVVARELKNRGSMSWVELGLSPRFRPALQTVLYRRLAEYSSPR